MHLRTIGLKVDKMNKKCPQCNDSMKLLNYDIWVMISKSIHCTVISADLTSQIIANLKMLYKD